jgi:hypothetical protein
MIHSDILTPRFLRAAAIAGVAVELSHYPCNNEENPSEQAAPSNGGQRSCLNSGFLPRRG